MQPEMDRLNLTHDLIVKAIGDRLYLAPLDAEKVQRALDIGTGTGVCTCGIISQFHRGRVASSPNKRQGGSNAGLTGAIEVGDMLPRAEASNPPELENCSVLTFSDPRSLAMTSAPSNRLGKSASYST